MSLKKIEKVTLIGMGALGIMYGEFFTEKLGKAAVSFVMNQDRIEECLRNPVKSNGKTLNFRVVSDEEAAEPADLLIFAVKATSLESAMDTARNQCGRDTIILSLLNGITSEEILGERFGKDKIIYCVAQGMDASKVGRRLTYTKIGELCIGIPAGEKDKIPKLEALCGFFDELKLPYTRERDIKQRLWSKFMLNVGVNQTVMVYEGTYKTVQEAGPARDLMQEAMREVIELSNHEGIQVTQEDLEYYVNLVDTLSPQGMPSMRQDGLEKRKSEVEMFSGTVLKLAQKHHIRTPVNERLYQQINDMQKQWEHR